MLLVLGFILLLLLVSWLVSMMLVSGVCGVIGKDAIGKQPWNTTEPKTSNTSSNC